MLNELGLKFEPRTINFQEDELQSPKFLSMNPFGKVPVYKDDQITLFESTAILNYLGEKHPDSGLVPKSGTVDRALYDQWMSFCISELEQPLWRIAKHAHLLPENKRIPAVIPHAKEEFMDIAKIFCQQLGARKFMVANRFTAVDITLAWTLNIARQVDILPFGDLNRYLDELMARPAFPKHLYE
jgi:glutathione S-transferase